MTASPGPITRRSASLSRSLRLAVVRSSTAAFDPTYYNLQELGMARALAAEGIETDVFVSKHASRDLTTFDFPSIDGVRVFPLPGRTLPGHQASMTGLHGHLAGGHAYDVIQVHEDYTWATLVAARIAKRRGSAVVLRQGVYEDYSRLSQRFVQSVWDRAALPYIREAVDIVAAKSRAAAEYCAHKGFDRIDVIPVGLDDDAFRSRVEVNWRRELGLQSTTRILLYVGELSVRRSLDCVIAALGQVVRTSCEDLCLVVVTRSSMPTSLEALLHRSGLSYRLLRDVPQTSLPSLYAVAHLTVLPSTYEIWGMTALESLYHGTPIVASATGGLRDILGASAAGALVPDNTAEAWQQPLQRMLIKANDASVRHAAADRGRELTWRRIAPRYASLLRDSVGGQRSEP